MSESTTIIEVSTPRPEELVDITAYVARIVRKRRDGICLVSSMHSTGSIFVNENEKGLCRDVLEMLDRVVPAGGWEHDRIDNNARAHLKSIIIGHSRTVPVQDGKLMLGTWQQIFFVEFDGPRGRQVAVTFVGE
jgi:secondary thiamine-phosphate synthase enzyme